MVAAFSILGHGRARDEELAKWVSDITYPRATDGRVCLTTGRDLFDRRVAGGALSADREAVHTTVAVLNMAFKNRSAR